MSNTLDFSKIYAHPLIFGNDLKKITQAHYRIEIKKGEYILREGQTARDYMILESGIVQSFVYDYKGNKITTDFFCKNEIIVQELSLFNHLPSAESIVALTDCIAWKIDFKEFQKLYHSLPGYAEWGRLFMTQKLFQIKKRSLEMITLPAKERYLQFLKDKPQVIQNVPLRQIASYLGITHTSLSRIRKEVSL
ncbi:MULTISPECIES: Crp/Fnr family transcriptional regulator [Capnocytophaga]|uniref:Crp/Fnr family transcriptional regulator n=1 Tax=Capnocytophaga stomatis TaxID=1848904 RepID=A0A250G008_9FLAO|nr:MULTISPECIES: Crp/Fnr family transcriptional regulator [Capnocytophaga]ATA73119.1 Crp/Fnr family transcriptional regulator [Capnocytophaga sp. H4358]ATA75207.1 Crp/Fnr family transcriptional regulator [Capnocytophaga sp. H2931]ATA90664.1 Crp/Fnr family transcriptional regulator [Capnocytophaga stomatis]CEN39557.1 Electron transport regulator A [Capnocytophaga cynodegmi]GIM58341.1 DNA-binding protein [Capnocytophaga canimorsus]